MLLGEVSKQVKEDEDIARARKFEAEREKQRLEKVSFYFNKYFATQ